MLLLPQRHISSFFELTPYECMAMLTLLTEMRRRTNATRTPDGYDIGVNVGESAGQTVLHVHMHLIPRFVGDVPHPRGAVHGVIPTRQSY